MRATPERVLRRVRAVTGTRGNERSSVAVARLVLRALLFDNQPASAWRADAACATEPVELFHPEPNDRAAVVAAKRVCARCSVRTECLADALAWETPSLRHGVLGGLSAAERARLTARRAAGGGEAA